ncbi:uncharacterized protein LOC112350478 [Selaginella moellendorffii]|uniref:uncharacterized protein LOC112350478 n=1 Tax=Selaginella moellendorffii TaxID=88036 RepID=UPI000D1C89B4|nr:uncharacterized protein LOC112350478 [Selaginella moellendorffii]|eukprot:XP_024542517.1 uncharacterized protein LOC112350478 [Selaginella moellendorffii]
MDGALGGARRGVEHLIRAEDAAAAPQVREVGIVESERGLGVERGEILIARGRVRAGFTEGLEQILVQRWIRLSGSHEVVEAILDDRAACLADCVSSRESYHFVHGQAFVLKPCDELLGGGVGERYVLRSGRQARHRGVSSAIVDFPVRAV